MVTYCSSLPDATARGRRDLEQTDRCLHVDIGVVVEHRSGGLVLLDHMDEQRVVIVVAAFV
jgi:hypothetical protein